MATYPFIGRRVKSCAVGSKPEFIGIAIARHPGQPNASSVYRPSYIVLDERDGTRWCRNKSELTLIEDPSQ